MRKHIQAEMPLTVGSGLAKNLWSVRRTSRDDFPTAASPVIMNLKTYCQVGPAILSLWGLYVELAIQSCVQDGNKAV